MFKRKKVHPSKRFPLLFIGPAFLILFVFCVLPIAVALVVSFTNMNITGLMDYSVIKPVWLDNYAELITSAEFRRSLLNTLQFVLMGVPLVIVLSLGAALLLNGGYSKLYGMFRVLYYLPSLTSVVAIAIVFSYLFNSQYGLINYLLSLVGIDRVMWLKDPLMAKIAVVSLAVWRSIGVNMIIFLAALKNIPDSLYEAACIDGAGRFKQLIHITLPSVRFALFYVSMTCIIAWMQFFEEAFIMTEGGPLGATKSAAMFLYESGFTMNRFGYTSAGSVILFVIIFVFTLAQNILRSRSEE